MMRGRVCQKRWPPDSSEKRGRGGEMKSGVRQRTFVKCERGSDGGATTTPKPADRSKRYRSKDTMAIGGVDAAKKGNVPGRVRVV